MIKIFLLCLWVLAIAAEGRAAEKIRVALPSLATALSPSWIGAATGSWKKYGLDVESPAPAGSPEL